MSTTYHKIAQSAAGAEGMRFGARAVALIAAGAIGGYLLRGVELPTTQVAQPIAATTIERTLAVPAVDPRPGFGEVVEPRPAVPAMDGSLGFWDAVDTRPAITAAQAAAAARESSEPWQASAWLRARGVEAGSADVPMGYWDFGDTLPAVSGGAIEPALAAAEASALRYETYDVVAGQPGADASAVLAGPRSQWYGDQAPMGATVPRSYADLATVGAADEYRDGVALGAPAKSYADLATVPGPTGADEPVAEPGRLVVREGAQGYETVRVPDEEELGPPAYVGSFWQFET